MSLKIEKRLQSIGLFFHEPENREVITVHWTVFFAIAFSYS